MNQRELLAAIAKILKSEEGAPLPRRAPKQNLGKAPPKMGRNTGRAQGLIGLSCMVPKKVYRLVVEHCRAEEITLSGYMRSLIDAAMGTDMMGTVTADKFRTAARFPARRTTYRSKGKQAPPPPPDSEPAPAPAKRHIPKAAKFGPKPKYSNEELAEFIELFHKENPKASAQQIFEHLRKEYGMKFSHNRAMGILRAVRANSLNGKSENVG